MVLLNFTNQEGNNSIATPEKCFRIFGYALLETQTEDHNLVSNWISLCIDLKKITWVGKSWTSIFLCWDCDSVCSHYERTDNPLRVLLSQSLPHLSLHSQTALAVQTLVLRYCHTPHWLPWRNSPLGLQGTQLYCLWLLYLDENMICWKGSTCFLQLLFAAFLSSSSSSRASIQRCMMCIVSFFSFPGVWLCACVRQARLMFCSN